MNGAQVTAAPSLDPRGHRLTWTLVAILALTFCWAGPGEAAPVRDTTSHTPAAAAVFDFLSTKELVLDGVVTAVQNELHVATGGCNRVPGQATQRAVIVRVSDVIQGSVTEDIAVVRILDATTFPELVPGARVIAYGARQSYDGWSIWGDCVVVTPSGQLAMARGAGEIDRDGNVEFNLPMLTGILSRIKHDSPYSPRSLFAGSPGLALVRVSSTTFLPS